MTTRASHATACLTSVVIATFVPISLYVAGIVIGSFLGKADMGGPLNFIIIPAATFLIGLTITATLYFPAGLLLAWMEIRFGFHKYVPMVVLGLSAILFAGLFAHASGPTLPTFSRTAAVWLVIAGLSFGLALHWTAFVIARSNQ